MIINFEKYSDLDKWSNDLYAHWESSYGGFLSHERFYWRSFFNTTFNCRVLDFYEEHFFPRIKSIEFDDDEDALVFLLTYQNFEL